MKIAVWHNLPSGGGKRALYHHVRGLVERGHRVESWRLISRLFGKEDLVSSYYAWSQE